MLKNRFPGIFPFDQLFAFKCFPISRSTQNHHWILSRHPFLGLQLCIRFTSFLSVCPYKWNPYKNMLILSQDSKQLALWNISRIVHFSYSVFAILRSIWCFRNQDIISQFISWFWVAICVSGSWLNGFYLYKLGEVCNIANITFEIVCRYNPGGINNLVKTLKIHQTLELPK